MVESTSPFPHDVALTANLLSWAERRITEGPDPRNGAKTKAELDAMLGGSITDSGIGGQAALDLFTSHIVPSTRPFDHPSSLAFVAAAPSPAALAFDAALGAAEIFAGNWDAGSGAIHAENQVLAWLAALAGLPDSAGGVFVAGGTMGNLSALHAARTRRQQTQSHPTHRWKILCSDEAHSSVEAVARVLDVELVTVASDHRGRMQAEAARMALAGMENPNDVFALVANAGATNCGAIDDLAGLAILCSENAIWMHVDGAYGLAALCDPATRQRFAGLDRADSFIVDPHKWLFAPYDSCALIYRDPAIAAVAHGQQAVYLDTLDRDNWNPSDYAIHLTRRARGLPLWFSLATYGAEAYGRAIADTLAITQAISDGLGQMEGLELLFEPQLSVILFRCANMDSAAMAAWAEEHRRSGALLCLPTKWRGEPVFRLCIVNPATDPVDILRILGTLAENPT